jgi:DNA-binding SARP family transcriptional activator
MRLLGREHIARSDVGALDLPDIWWPVLGCLLAAPNRCLSRSAMAGRLWPDKGEQAARHCLATALWRIKSRLPRDQKLVSLDGETMRLSLTRFDFVDVLVLQRRAQATLRKPGSLAAAGDRLKLARALGFYEGCYLAERDHECIAFERERLRTLYIDALFALAQAEARAENWQAARAAGQTLCAIEPLREDAQRLLMTSHVHCGSRALALSQYRSLVAVLQAELDIGPMAETQRLAAEIGGRVPGAEVGPVATCDSPRSAMLRVRDNLQEAIRVIEAALEA